MRSESQKDMPGFWAEVHPSEAQVAAAWERRSFHGDALQTVDGQLLQVIFPGRKSGLRGPDFSDAILTIGGSLRKGSVEIHVRSSDFARHGHNQDTHYDRLVLHVVLLHDTEENMLNGKVPIFEMGRLLECLPDASNHFPDETSLPCVGAAEQIGIKRLVHHLEEAGKARFKMKAGRFLGDICYFGEEETLYQGVMEALGYSQNKAPFLALARAVPSVVFQTISGSSTKDLQQRINAIMAWASGLDIDLAIPQEAQSYGAVQLKREEWELSRLRPDNYPLSRIEGMACLMARAYSYSSGLGEYLLETLDSPKGFSEVVKRLCVHENDRRTLIGPQRASEIAINVALPFAYAQAELKSDLKLAYAILNAYSSAAKSSENHITRQMYQQFGLTLASLKTGCQQQGLLHIYKERCQDLRCADCGIASEMQRVLHENLSIHLSSDS